MRTIFVLDNGGIGGAEKLTVSLAEKIVEHGHQAAILILERDKSIVEFTNNKDIKFFFALRRFKLDLLAFLGKIKKILNEYDPQIVVTNGLFSYVFISLSLKSLKSKTPVLLIFHSISPFSFKYKVFDLFYTIFLNIFKGKWIILYSSQKQALVKRFLLKEKDFEIIPGGVDISFYNPATHLCKYQDFDKKDIFTITHIASLKPIKNQKALFKGLKVFEDKTKANWQLLIAGEGECGILERYKKILTQLGIINRVKFLGVINDVRKVLCVSDIFVLTSITETLPLSALEALSMGVPCILPRVGGCPHIIEEGVNGYLIRPNDYTGLGNLVADIYADTEQLQILKEQSRRTAVEKFDFKNTVHSFINLCEKEALK